MHSWRFGSFVDLLEEIANIKLTLADKKGALVDLGRHLGVFVKKHQHAGEDGGPIIWQSYPEDAKL